MAEEEPVRAGVGEDLYDHTGGLGKNSAPTGWGGGWTCK